MIGPAETLLSVEGLEVHFPVRRGWLGGQRHLVKAVDGICFDIRRGETVALVGESGCGKSTAGNAILGLVEATAGRILFEGDDLREMSPELRRSRRTAMQVIFQDSASALDPKMTIGRSIAEPLEIDGMGRAERRRRVDELLDQVGLGPSYRERYPNALSGGQRQRVVIARALARSPKLLICDEPVSALDVSIRSQILNLLMRLQRDLGLAFLFISHDLSVVRHIADRVLVMYLGTIVEEGDAEPIFEAPVHPYTEALLSAIPVPDPVRQRLREKIILHGELPSPLDPPIGCPFVGRCPIRIAECTTHRPALEPTASGSRAACLVRAPSGASRGRDG